MRRNIARQGVVQFRPPLRGKPGDGSLGKLADFIRDDGESLARLARVGGLDCGVLDIDSPIGGRFTGIDKEGLEAFARILESACDWEQSEL